MAELNIMFVERMSDGLDWKQLGTTRLVDNNSDDIEYSMSYAFWAFTCVILFNSHHPRYTEEEASLIHSGVLVNV